MTRWNGQIYTYLVTVKIRTNILCRKILAHPKGTFGGLLADHNRTFSRLLADHNRTFRHFIADHNRTFSGLRADHNHTFSGLLDHHNRTFSGLLADHNDTFSQLLAHHNGTFGRLLAHINGTFVFGLLDSRDPNFKTTILLLSKELSTTENVHWLQWSVIITREQPDKYRCLHVHTHTHTCSPLAFHECTTDWSLACNKPTAGRLAHTGFNPTGERAFLPGCVAQLTSLRAPAKSITKKSSMFIHNNHTEYSKNTLSHKKNQTVNCPRWILKLLTRVMVGHSTVLGR